MKNQNWFERCTALLVLGVLLNGFAYSQDDCEEGLSAFEATVYTKVAIDCSQCHDGSDSKAPAFVNDDPKKSYRFLLNYVDFLKANESLLSVRAGNGHCKMSSCDEASGRDMAEQIKAWWNEGEKTCERKGRYFSSDLDLTRDLPKKGEGFKKLTWDLGVMGSQFAGTSLEIEAQLYFEAEGTAPGTYRFRKPRFVSGDKVLKISNLKILLNGRFDSLANHYSSIERVVSPQVKSNGVEQSPYPVLSPRSLLLLEDKGADDKVAVSFENIEVLDSPSACKDIASFRENVLTQYKAMNCYECHGGGESSAEGTLPAKSLFNMALSEEKLCQASLERVDLKNVLHSPLISYPLRGSHEHPNVEGNLNQVLNGFRSWIDAERKE